MASARLSEQLCRAAGRGTARAQPRRGPKTCRPPLPGDAGRLTGMRGGRPGARSPAGAGEKPRGLGREGAAVAGL